jgi:hypothetical protein
MESTGAAGVEPSGTGGEQPKVQTFQVEVRFDVTGTVDEARAAGAKVAGELDGSVSGVFDEDWNEV